MKNIEEIINEGCKDGREFYHSCSSLKEAWDTCYRGDWMLWLAQKLDVDIRTLTLAKTLCANTVRHLMSRESKEALLISLRFGRGKATKEELNKAKKVANAAAYAAANAAVYADAVAYAAANAAAYAATNADAAADAAAYDAADTKLKYKKENQLKTANICRKILTKEVFNKLNIKNNE